MTREAIFEKLFVAGVAAIGGRAYKFEVAGRRGVPDRLVCLPGGRVHLVELKRPDGKGALDRRQIVEIDALRALGASVLVIDNHADMEAFLQGSTTETMTYGRHHRPGRTR